MFLNIKTENSFLQSLCKVEQLIEYAKKNEIHELGIVDENILIDIPKFILSCKEANIKPIIGVRKKISNFYKLQHIVIYALNEKGILKINQLPDVIENIIDLNDDNLCLVVEAEDMSTKQSFDLEDIKTNIKKQLQLRYFKNFYFNYNEKLLAIENDEFLINNMIFNPEIAFFEDSEIDYFIVLKSILHKTSYLEEKKSKDKYRMLSFEANQKKIKSVNEIIKNNTHKFISNVEQYNISYEYQKVLNFGSFTNIKFETVLNEKLKTYLELMSIVEKEVYYERLKEEIDVIKDMNFENYFLIMEDIIKYLIKNDIPYGYGRGSAAGSLVSFLLKITLIDPIEYGLYFERFLNKKRSSLPDIDLDVSDIHRQQLITYLIRKYGDKHVAKIFTVNKYLVKSAFSEVAKSLGLENNLIKKINNNLSPKLSFEENIIENYQFFSKYESDVKFDFMRESMKRIENLSRNLSIHAAGVVISSINLEQISPIVDNVIYSEAKALEKLGFIKFDLLALSTLSFIRKLENRIKIIDSEYSSESISLKYSKVYENLKEAKTLGVFQLESQGIRKVLKKYEPKTLMDIAIVIALYRPGPMQNIDLLVNNKSNHKNIKYIHEDLKPILEQTYGIIVFQEQIMEIVKKVASYSNAEADIFRVAISKKNIEAITKIKADFLNRGLENGYSPYTLNKLYNNIEKFAGYGFNKAHAISYARLIYRIMYIKSKYPTIFFAELFSSMINSPQKEEFLLELFNMSIEVYPPRVHSMSQKNTLKRGRIILSINNIKGIPKNKLENIINVTQEKQEQYANNIIDFLEEVIIPLNLNDKEKLNLVCSGLFDTYSVNRKSVYLTLNKYSKIDLDILKFTKERIKIVESEDFDFITNAKYEKDSLGFNLQYSSEEYLIRKLNKKHPNAKLTNIAFDADDLEILRTYFVLGQIIFIKEIKTKTDKPMAFLTFKNRFKNIDITIFPEDYQKYSEIITKKKNEDVIIKMNKNKRGSLIFEDIFY